MDEFLSLARTDAGLSVVKFVIPDLPADRSDDPAFAPRLLDGNFYELHDEWYWFQLLNGLQPPGFDAEPIDLDLSTIEEIYAWAEPQTNADLPFELRLTDSGGLGRPRLYSETFYDEAISEDDDRRYGVGSIVRIDADVSATGDDLWLIELEFSDDPTDEEIGWFFDRLAPILPPEIADTMVWVVRSPQQEATAVAMEEAVAPFSDRIVRYSEVLPAGDVRVYNPGVAAGRLRLIEPGSSGATTIANTQDTDILLVENVPDWLPPAGALLTSSPQTPLAHVNLLARNRGIPNASISGLLEDPAIVRAARSRAPAIVRADADGNLEVVLITADELLEWRSLGELQPITVPPGPADAPTLIDLTALEQDINTEADVAAWRPVIGGKAAGFLALIGADDVSTPPSPVAISVGPYRDHLSLVVTELDAMLTDPTFMSETWARFLLLEGPEDFAQEFDPDGRFTAEVDAFNKNNPPGTPLGDILDAGGFKSLFRDQTIDPETLAEITDYLADIHAELAPTQGLRFRSSSSVEDIEGFNGAGLYDSNTGFLRTDLLEEGDQKRTVEWALKKTWASYWGFEAFEERRRERVDHRSGAMGVLVHPRFDDELEGNNGVATLTLTSDDATVVINVQRGDVSVTNPDPDDIQLPEEVVVTRSGTGQWAIERIAESTIPADDGRDGPVMSDEAVIELADQLFSATVVWRERTNASLPDAQHVSTVTLDFEFKTMLDGWPMRSDGQETPGRLVVKQARSLDPGLRLIPADVATLDIPRDVLARARLVDRLACETPDGTSVVIEVLTDPLLAPDVGFGTTPLRVGDDAALAALDRNPSACARSILFSSPDQFLLELLETESRLDLLAS